MNVDKEKVRLLVQSIGYKAAADQSGVKYATLRQWARRGKWNDVVPKYNNAVTTRNTQPKLADLHADTLRSLENDTKLSLATYAQRASKHAEGATLRDSGHVKEVAQTAAIVHRWNDQKNSAQILNIAVLTGQERPQKTIEATIIPDETD